MDLALAWLEGVKERKFFAWVHLYDPHTPYEPPEPFLSRYPGPAVRRRGRLHRPGGRAARLLAQAGGRLGPHRHRAPRRPRREPGRARRERAHLLRLRRDAARAAHRPDAVGRPRPQPRPGLDGGRDADRARPRGPFSAARHRRPLARAARAAPRRRVARGRLLGDLLPALPLRLAAPARDARRQVEVHRGADPGALRRAAGPGRDEERLQGLLAPRRGPAPRGSRRWRAAASRPPPTRRRSTPRRCSGSRRSATWAAGRGWTPRRCSPTPRTRSSSSRGWATRGRSRKRRSSRRRSPRCAR